MLSHLNPPIPGATSWSASPGDRVYNLFELLDRVFRREYQTTSGCTEFIDNDVLHAVAPKPCDSRRDSMESVLGTVSTISSSFPIAFSAAILPRPRPAR